MALQSLSVSEIHASYIEAPIQPVGEAAFGGVYTAYTNFDKYVEIADQLGTDLLRWPGGTLAETRPDRYGLEHENLQVEGPNRPGLDDLIQYSHESGDALSIILPTHRYTDDLDYGKSLVSDFMDRLDSGFYGEIPNNFTIEIGNEYYAHFSNPADYGKVANEFVEIISSKFEVASYDTSLVNVAVQAGKTSADNEIILDQFSDDALSAVTHIVGHRLTPGFGYSDKLIGDLSESLEDWDAAVEAAGGDNPDLYLSAWNVLSWKRVDAEKQYNAYYEENFGEAPDLTQEMIEDRTNNDFEEFWQHGILKGPDGEVIQTGSGLANHEYGPEKETAVMDLFTSYAELGLDMSAIYGVDIPYPSNFGSIEGRGEDAGTDMYSGSGAFKLLSEVAPGMSPVKLDHENVKDPSPDTGPNQWAFVDEDKTAIFLAAGSLEEGETMDVSIELGDDVLAAYGDVVVRTPDEDWQKDNDIPETPEVDTSPEAELHEEVTIEGFTPDVKDGTMSYTFTEPYQMIRVTLAHNKEVKAELDEWMRAEAATNDFFDPNDDPASEKPIDETDPVVPADPPTEDDQWPDIPTAPSEGDEAAPKPQPKPDGSKPDVPETAPEKGEEEDATPPSNEGGSPGKDPIQDDEDDPDDDDLEDDPYIPDIPADDNDQADHEEAAASSGSSCLAIAVYVDPRHPDVKWLRDFRDDVLLPHPVGRKLISCYWAVGPRLAALSARNPFVSNILRKRMVNFVSSRRRLTSEAQVWA